MILTIAQLLERYLNVPVERSAMLLGRLTVTLAAALFLLLGTGVVAFENLFQAGGGLATLRAGDVAPVSVYAPETRSYTSDILTDLTRQAAREGVQPIYSAADLNVARTQTVLTGRILDYINNVRRDRYASDEQRRRDLLAVSNLTLSDTTLDAILALSEEDWQAVDSEVRALLEQVMRDSIRAEDIPAIHDRLPNQVSLRFDEGDVAIIVAIVEDLIRPNRSIDEAATAQARDEAAAAVQPQQVGFQRGQIIVGEGDRVEAIHLEAMAELGLLQPEDQRLTQVGQAMIAVLGTMVLFGLYLARFRPSLLYSEPRLLVLLAVIFLLLLGAVHLTGGNTQIYLYPSAVLALLYVALIGPQTAIIGTLGLAFLVGFMNNASLEAATLVTFSGLIAVLALRRSERLNSYFVAGLMVSLINVLVAAVFRLDNLTLTTAAESVEILAFAFLNGLIAAAASVVGLYVIGQVFNLTTAVRLIELSQPGQALLQRLLREAPGTYQHSLQVANLSEQAVNAIGGNAQLAHVAGLYHDIGKMSNPAFFTENQRDIGRNPHDTLNDPYRSADIIIGHVTEGEEMARRYRLPARIRDFIREHHGTSQVYVFYQQALAAAGDDKDAVDLSEFTYPGPRPRSRETAVMMLADSCEAAVRAQQPESRKQIEETVNKIIEGKRQSGQLDESNLTLNDLNTVRTVFIDMLQATFHPRINYAEAVARARQAASSRSAVGSRAPTPDSLAASAASSSSPSVHSEPKISPAASSPKAAAPAANDSAAKASSTPSSELPASRPEAAAPTLNSDAAASPAPVPLTDTSEDDDDSPLPDVPPLPRSSNGKPRSTATQPQVPLDAEPDIEDEESEA